jgi:hypothetical protein
MWGGILIDQRTTLKVGSNLENNENNFQLKRYKFDFASIKVLFA